MFQQLEPWTFSTGNEPPKIYLNLSVDRAYKIDFKNKDSGQFQYQLLKPAGYNYFLSGSNTFPGAGYDAFAVNDGGTQELHYFLNTPIKIGDTLIFETIIGTPSEVVPTQVAGVVQIDGKPAGRLVRAFTYDSETMTLLNREVNAPRPLGETSSDPETGEYQLIIESGYTDEVFVVAFDEYGQDFSPDMNLAVGDKIHPTTPNGYVFECTGAGQLPSEEPAWIINTETSQTYGTAAMIAVPFYRPMVHGPVTPQVQNIEPQ